MRIIACLSMLLLFAGCADDSGFEQYVILKKKELANGRQVNNLFFGINLGMTSKQFFTHCWELNKKGLFTDGENNTAVLYKLNHNELKYPASMNFYPDFYNDKIYKMRVIFRYDAWAPWNKHLNSDSLQTDVLNLYKKWYKEGNPFIQVNDKERGVIYVKVDGNRRIIIGKYDEINVKVDYTDLLFEDQLKK